MLTVAACWVSPQVIPRVHLHCVERRSLVFEWQNLFMLPPISWLLSAIAALEWTLVNRAFPSVTSLAGVFSKEALQAVSLWRCNEERGWRDRHLWISILWANEDIPLILPLRRLIRLLDVLWNRCCCEGWSDRSKLFLFLLLSFLAHMIGNVFQLLDLSSVCWWLFRWYCSVSKLDLPLKSGAIIFAICCDHGWSQTTLWWAHIALQWTLSSQQLFHEATLVRILHFLNCCNLLLELEVSSEGLAQSSPQSSLVLQDRFSLLVTIVNLVRSRRLKL